MVYPFVRPLPALFFYYTKDGKDVNPYPHAAEKFHWATQDCMSLDGVPYIGPYSASTSGLYVATGFNNWGMTSSMVSAMLLCDLVQGRESPYGEVFSPSRSAPVISNSAGVKLSSLYPIKTPLSHT